MSAASQKAAGTESRHFLTSISTETQLEHAVGKIPPSADFEACAAEVGPSRSPCETEILGRRLSNQFKAHGADLKRSLFQLATTATPFIALLVVMAAASHSS
jgi:hypothetical protein